MQPHPGGLEPPARLGPYRLDQMLGSGGMGAVWRAWDERLERWVALKQIRADAALHHGRERLRREARAAARLNHPAIVHVYDLLEGTDGDWIVMELVEGRTLRRLLDEEAALVPQRAVQLGREILEGLAEAHAQGILHRDLKSANVIVTATGRAKILDFGLAKEIPRGDGTASADLTGSMPGAIVGTCFAMSPEQVMGCALDQRSDLFSFGSLFYEMLTGEAPFRAANETLSLARVIHHRVPPLQESHPEIPSEIGDLVSWLLQKEPIERPESAVVVLAALDSATGSAGWQAAPARLLPPPSRQELTTAVTLAEPPAGWQRGEVDESRPSSGERRTVTIVGCTLVELDRPSREGGALDIEVLSGAAAAFESLGQEICRELAGSLCAVLGRTICLCFGYPQAHENDAERAVRAAQELQRRFAAFPAAAAHRLGMRAGVHTGPAVVVSRAAAGQALQAGDTLETALAIQSQVAAGRIAVSAASRRLLGRKFATRDLPAVHLQDLGSTVAVYELGSPLAATGQESASPAPLVNREAEMHILLDLFRLARSGSGQAVLIAGDAGIGKSRLVRALFEQLTGEAPAWLTAYGSTFAQNTPLAPIVNLLDKALFAPDGGAETAGELPGTQKLAQLDAILHEYGLPRPEYIPLLGALLSLPADERYPAPVLSPEARRKRTLHALVTLLGSMAERSSLVLVVEDLHWIDPSSLEFLDLLLRELPALPLLLVATFRPEFSAPWPHQTSVTQLNLGGLNAAHTAQLIEQVSEGRGLPAEMRREIAVRTDGIPLFVEELTKAVLETEAPLRQPAGIPFTLDGSLLARLDRLGEAKVVAQLAAVIGRTFTLDLLEALSWIKGAALQNALGRLLQAEILHRRGPALQARYIFKHALIQNAAYLSLLASDRQRLHQQLARLLQKELPAVAEAEPELMAHHCERGGLIPEAIEYLQGAGLRAVQRSAHHEAASHLSRALDLLLGLPATPERTGRELTLRSVLVAVVGAIRGWGAPEAAANAERCVTLCRELGDSDRLIPSLYGMWTYHILRGNRQPAFDLSAEIARFAKTPVQVFIGYTAQVVTNFWNGRLTEMLALFKQAAALYEPNLLPEFAQVFGEESTLLAYVSEFWGLWILGCPEEAIRKRNAMLAIVEPLRSPFQLGFALLFDMILWRELRETEEVARVGRRLLELATEQELPLLRSLSLCGLGWADCQRGDLAGGMAQIQAGLDMYKGTGARLPWGYWHSYLIEAQLAAGQIAAGLAALREAKAAAEVQLDTFFIAELHRLEGELLCASGDAGAAEAALRNALAAAREQGARSFELRAATSLGRLLAEQGRGGEALPALRSVCATFREGLATRDLNAARGLLERLVPRLAE